jgi:thiol-disulfide isomerase/thioredoxin
MNTNSKLIAALVIVLLVAGGAAMFLLREGPKPVAPAATERATAHAVVHHFVPVQLEPDFAAIAPLDSAGKPVDMTAYRGKALLVNLWATWCAPCIKELPALAELEKSLGGADFAVVTIALDEPDAAKVPPFLAQHGPGLPALIDTNRTIDKVMRVAALPTSLLVDKEGKVRAVLIGDAEWHCGAALAVVKAFIADGTVSQDKLEPCS